MIFNSFISINNYNFPVQITEKGAAQKHHMIHQEQGIYNVFRVFAEKYKSSERKRFFFCFVAIT